MRCTRFTTSRRSTLTATARTRSSLAAWEGVYLLNRDSGGRWSKTQLGVGNQDSTAEQGFKRSQGRPSGRRPPLHRHDRALARIPGRRLHPAGVGPGALGSPGRRCARAMGPRRLVRRPRWRRRPGADHRPARQGRDPNATPRAPACSSTTPRRARPRCLSPATSSTTAASAARMPWPPTSTATAASTHRRRPLHTQCPIYWNRARRVRSGTPCRHRSKPVSHADPKSLMKAFATCRRRNLREDQILGAGASLRAEPGRPDAVPGLLPCAAGSAGRHSRVWSTPARSMRWGQT